MNEVKFLNPFTDFGFKKIFGEDPSLSALRSFLNSLLPEKHQVKTLSLKNSEFMGRSKQDRKAVFDLYCESTTGEQFIVELQKEKQNFFKDRSVYYATFPIQKQAKRGKWDFELKTVYCVGILDFCFEEEGGEVYHHIQLKNESNEVFYDKLSFIYLEMPNFKKSMEELETKMDHWFYFFKHLEHFEEVPRIFFGKEGFEEAFDKAKKAALSLAEYWEYEDSLKVYRDLHNIIQYREDKGHAEGLAEGLAEGHAKGLEEGERKLRINVISQLRKRGLSEDEIDELLG